MRLRSVLTALFFLPAVSPLVSAGEAALFTRYIANLKYRQPLSYTAVLTGSAVSGRLKQIPPDALVPGPRPVVRVYSKRYAGQVILVENVDEVFRKMFSLYNNYINMTGMYIMSKGETWSAFSRQYGMTVLRNTGAHHVLKIRAKNHPPDSYGLFYVSVSTMMIRKAVFYSRGSKIYSVSTTYTPFGRFLMPYRIVIQRIRDDVPQKPAVILFSGYRLNVPIPGNVF